MYQNFFFIPLRKKAAPNSHLPGCTNRPVSNKAVPPVSQPLNTMTELNLSPFFLHAFRAYHYINFVTP